MKNPPSRNWLCTLNSPKVDPQEYLEAWSKVDGCKYVTGQLEKAESGTIHIQYFLHFESNRRGTALKEHCSKSHFEIVKINNGADRYCMKEDTRVDGPWEFGIPPARRNVKGDLKSRNQYIMEYGVVNAVKEGHIDITKFKQANQSVNAFMMVDTPPFSPPAVRGIWIWGSPGVGKSFWTRKQFPALYVKSQSKWWEGYTGQHFVLLDDHDNPCLGHYLKVWADEYPCIGEDKGGSVSLQHRRFIVTSNYSIETLYQKDGPEMVKALERRFIQHRMTDRDDIPDLDGVL